MEKIQKEIIRREKEVINAYKPNKLDKTDITTNDRSMYENKDNLIQTIKEKKPKFFETFELNNFIKSGGSGIVYEASYKKTKIKVGCKFYINHKHKDKQNEEINYLKKLKNKGIISLFGFMKISEEIDISILELAKWGDLDNFQYKIIKKKYLSETFICYITFQILETLNYIHRNKIFHSDIKQGNILIDSNLNVRLTDFSVSSSYESFNDDQKIIFPFAGTGKYISPEILGSQEIYAKDSNKIDIYSLGIMIFYLIYGTYPYNLKDVKSSEYNKLLETLKNQKELIFPENRKISPMFKNFLKRILEIDINKRFSISEAIKHPWVKGGEIIIDEKEKINSIDKFVIELTTDSIYEFNKYIKESRISEDFF